MNLAPLALLVLQLVFLQDALALTPHLPKVSRTEGFSANTLDRRDWILQWSSLVSASALLLQSPHDARAVGEGAERMVFRQKPTAPIGALVPAIQQRLLLEGAVDLTSKNEFDKSKLKDVVPPLDEDAAFGNTNSRDAKVFKKYNPAYVLRGDLTRATMNLYQTNLNYNNLLSNPEEAFTITDSDWKKSYIRANDGLPDLHKVIGADLDMRQLLRNKVQQKLDDAAAELYAEDCDDEELRGLLKEAAQSFDLWLDRVRYGDVRDAIEAALKGERIQVYDSFAAGFLPPKVST